MCSRVQNKTLKAIVTENSAISQVQPEMSQSIMKFVIPLISNDISINSYYNLIIALFPKQVMYKIM